MPDEKKPGAVEPAPLDSAELKDKELEEVSGAGAFSAQAGCDNKPVGGAHNQW